MALVTNSTDPTSTPLVRNATESDLERARRIVEDALAEAARRNEDRQNNPARNVYGLRPGTVVGGGRGRSRRAARRAAEVVEAPPPLLKITPEIAAAAALVAEAAAVGRAENLTKRAPAKTQAGTFWMESIARKGTVAFSDGSGYSVSGAL
jgi:hypothetical protein